MLNGTWLAVLASLNVCDFVLHQSPQSVFPQMCPRYWPAEVGDAMRLDALEVEMETEETIEDNIISRQFKITNTKNVSELK